MLGGARGSEVHAPAPVLAQDTEQDTDRDADSDAPPGDPEGRVEGADPGPSSGGTDDAGPGGEQDAGEPDGADPSPDDDPSLDDESTADDDDGGHGGPATVTVVLDGVCEIETDTAQRDVVAAAPAWTQDDCTYAPVAVARSEPAWIVVRASLNGDDFAADDARDRAAALGATGGVLWSSHYPSLNPDLWVVYDGPFPGRDAARRAAAAAGGGAYARTLSVDDTDRFCIAADGCVGERAD